MNKNFGTILGIVLVLALGIGLVMWRPSQPVYAGLDEFAACLTEKGVIMYGAEWCPHCKQQKAMFGEAFKKVTYVECPIHTELCNEKKVTGYPTWIFKDDSRLDGEQTISALAEKSQCPLPPH